MVYFWTYLGIFCFLLLMLHGLFTIVGMKKVIPNLVKALVRGAFSLIATIVRGIFHGIGILIAAPFHGLYRGLRGLDGQRRNRRPP